MVKVVLEEKESLERLLSRFKRKFADSKVLKKYEENRYFISKSERKRSKKRLSKRRKQQLLKNNE